MKKKGCVIVLLNNLIIREITMTSLNDEKKHNIKRPVKRRKLSDVIEEQLEGMIRQGEFKEGERLPSERALMEMFDVGRPSIREAIAGLKRKGLVQLSNGERPIVTTPSADTLVSLMSGAVKDLLTQPDGIRYFEQLRELFEIGIVRYAAEHATEAQINELYDALVLNKNSLENHDKFVYTDIAFHRVLASIPSNPLFLSIHSALLKWLIEARIRFNNTEKMIKNNTRSYHEHVAIYEAIKNKNVMEAERAIKIHIENVFEHYYP